MSNQEPPGAEHRSHQTDAEAHPERAVDELEERVVGQRMDQVRDDEDQNHDEQAPGTEQP